MEMIPFEAYLHVNAVMWRQVFKELRALTNDASVKLTPFALNELYEHLWHVGGMLQTESCLDIFDDDFRPWPKHQAEMGGDNFYAIHDRVKVADLEHLRSYQTREDIGVYQTVLMEVFKLFGEGIQESLARTMGDYLEATGGVLANSKKTEWEKDVASRMLSTNNAAEGPFAVIRAFLHMYPSLKLQTVVGLSAAMVNGTHRSYGAKKDAVAGIALTAPERLRAAVTKLCSVRIPTTRPLNKSQSDRLGSVGAITIFLRGTHEVDKLEAAANRKENKQKKLDKSARLQAQRMENFDKASETQLARTIQELRDEIQSYGLAKGALLKYLKDQYSARILLRDGDYSTIPQQSEYRMKKKPFKLRMEPHKPPVGTLTTSDRLRYLSSLLEVMMTEDLARAAEQTVTVEETGLVRRLPVISTSYVNPVSVRLKRLQETEIAQKMAPTDNPWLSTLEAAWVGKILYDGGYFRVVKVQSNPLPFPYPNPDPSPNPSLCPYPYPTRYSTCPIKATLAIPAGRQRLNLFT
jgi:hypothetical protein